MRQIQRIVTYMFHDGELVALCLQIADLCIENKIDSPLVLEAIKKLEDAALHLEKVSGSVRSSSETNELKALDWDRERVYQLIYTTIKSCKEIKTDTEIAEAGRELYRIWHVFPPLYRSNYIETGPNIDALLREMKTNKCEPLLEMLHLKEWVEELKELNALFQDTYIHRNMTNSLSIVPKGEGRRARKECAEGLEFLALQINSLVVVTGTTEYNALINEINDSIKFAKDNTKRRGKRKGEED